MQVGSFLRRAWIPLLVVFVTLLSSSLALATWWLKGAERWLFLGVASSSCIWLIALIVILWSGIGPKIMGIEGEGMTADTLRGFKKEGWTLINGLRFPDSGDIDHILIGPAGIFIFETKWSGSRWPMRGEKWTYITNELNRAIKQVKENREDISKKISSAHGYIPMYAVCVLWSAADSQGDDTTFELKSPDNVFGVKGKVLDEWLKLPRRNVLTDDQVKRIALELSEMAIISDTASKETYRRTLTRIMVELVLVPILAFVLPFWIERFITLTHNGYIDLGGLLALTAVGIYIRLRTRLKAVTVCWFASLGTMAGYLLVHEVHFLLSRN